MKIDKKTKEVIETVLSVIGSLAIAGLAVYFVFNAIIPKLNVSKSYDLVSMDSASLEESMVADTDDYAREASDYSVSNTQSKLKKQGNVNILVDNLDTSYSSVYEIMQNYDGQLISSYESGEGNDRTVSLTIKIPSTDFENVYAELKDIDGEIVSASYSTQDVTMEYTDLESRLTNLESVETQLVKILNTAETVSDTLDVYSELTTIRSQIEVIKGQLKYMDNQVDYSYITVTLGLSESGMAIVDDAWKPWGVFKSAFTALVEMGKTVVNTLIWVLVFSPIVALVVVIVVLLTKKKSKK
jgi:hypothetical protein